MRRVPLVCLVTFLPALAAAGEPLPADGPAVDSAAPAPEHANPRAQIAYRGFGIAGLAGGTVALSGGQLDLYPVSRPWMRAGFEAELGSGSTTVEGVDASLWYALGGLTAAIQYPARVTPFIEGRVAGGVLSGSGHGTATTGAGATAIQGLNAATVLYLGGVEAGVAIYTVGRAYLSISLGWVHPVYVGPSPTALQAGTVRVTSLAADTFTFKIGLGI